MLKESKIGKKLMVDAKNMNNQFYKQYLIEVDKQDHSFKKMNIVGESSVMNSGNVDRWTVNKKKDKIYFEFQLSGNSFLSYNELERQLQYQLELATAH